MDLHLRVDCTKLATVLCMAPAYQEQLKLLTYRADESASMAPTSSYPHTTSLSAVSVSSVLGSGPSGPICAFYPRGCTYPLNNTAMLAVGDVVSLPAAFLDGKITGIGVSVSIHRSQSYQYIAFNTEAVSHA